MYGVGGVSGGSGVFLLQLCFRREGRQFLVLGFEPLEWFLCELIAE